jgi:hypothetical protein
MDNFFNLNKKNHNTKNNKNTELNENNNNSLLSRVSKSSYTVTDVFKGILILTLAVMGNYIGEMLSCKVQYILTVSGWAKNGILLFTIFFALTVFSDDTLLHPKETLKFTIVLFIGFKLFSKTSMYFSGLIFGIISIIYVISTFIDYYEKTNTEKKIRKTLKKIEQTLIIVLVFVIIFGSSQYLYFKYNEYKDTKEGFSIIKYFFTATQCNSLKALKS